jgi:hypothetical protein
MVKVAPLREGCGGVIVATFSKNMAVELDHDSQATSERMLNQAGGNACLRCLRSKI